jgi:D-glycero-alpha-D-manno-heptose-7-phosphate kinase
LVVNHDQKVLQGVEAIEASVPQIALVVDESKKLLGTLTNGDVRRYLMAGGSVNYPITECMNREFRWVDRKTSREEILKLFDLGFKALPVLDDSGTLIDFVTPDYFPPADEGVVLARARAPVRVSFSGGGSDLTYYFMEHKGAVLHTTISLYAHATLIPSKDPRIRIISHDIDREERYDSLRELLDSRDRGLLSSVVAVIRPDYGFELYVHSDFPVGSGLGGSSAVAISVVSAFNELRLDKWSTYEVAEVAFHAERLCFGIEGGWQDQYASAFGGFNLIEFDGSRNLVHSLRIQPDILNELEECLMLCDTGIKHHSGEIHEIQRRESSQDEKHIQIERMVDLSSQMHKFLIRGDLRAFGEALHDTWMLKHSLSSAISDTHIDNIYASARDAGALGGKLLGAGGGGFFLFFVLPRNRAEVTARLQERGCKISSLRFDREGVTSWRTKIL